MSAALAQHITITVLCNLHVLLAEVSAQLVAFYICEAIASFNHCHLPAHHHHIHNFSRLGQLCHALPVCQHVSNNSVLT